MNFSKSAYFKVQGNKPGGKKMAQQMREFTSEFVGEIYHQSNECVNAIGLNEVFEFQELNFFAASPAFDLVFPFQGRGFVGMRLRVNKSDRLVGTRVGAA